MKPVIDILEERITSAMCKVTGLGDCAAVVTPATDAKFGDFQANGVMNTAKKLRTNPRKLAQEVAAGLDIDDICLKPEVAGAGFINLRLKHEFLEQRLLEIIADPAGRLGIEKSNKPQTVVVDFSSPNIAKEMHVGHLRSTIIGDCICRMLEFAGHKVIRQNHIGDWGTQFGRVVLGLWHLCMAKKKGGEPYYISELEKLKRYAGNRKLLEELCCHIHDRHEEDWRNDSLNELGDGEKYFHPFLKDIIKHNRNRGIWDDFLAVYQYTSALEDSISGMNLQITTRNNEKEIIQIPYESLSRHTTAMLQKGGDRNEQELKARRFITDFTLEHTQEIYDLLGVTLTIDDVRGESFYNNMLSGIVKELKDKKIAVESEGAVCVFSEGFKNKDGEPLPFIIQKSDGAYLYATTDLAALKYRIETLKADRIVYVTDSRQKLHFEMLFAVAKMTGWLTDDIKRKHVMFGTVLGEDGKPLKTRSGENVKLKELLEEAALQARAVVEEKNPEFPEGKKEQISRAVGIGAVKYADYANNRTSDYVFSFDRMLAMEGNTAPYMQYAYARIKSIERRAASKDVDIEKELAGITNLSLSEPAELDLAKHLIGYCQAVQTATVEYRPNYLTGYLYELAQKFSGFYAACPVLDSAPAKRPSRLFLCDLTAQTIKHGLTRLLGIQVIEQM